MCEEAVILKNYDKPGDKGGLLPTKQVACVNSDVTHTGRIE